MDGALLHALNGFAFRHDAFEDPLALYVGAADGVGRLTVRAMRAAVSVDEPAAPRRGP